MSTFSLHFDVDQLREHAREPWMEIYDFTYLDEKIIGGIEKNFPSVAEIIAIVEKRATGKITSKLAKSLTNIVDSQEGME